MAENSDIREMLYGWVAAQSNLTRIIWAFQNQPRPARPYVLLRMFSDAPMKYTYQHVVAAAGSPGYGQEILGSGSFVVSLFVIGETGIDDVPRDTMRDLRASLEDPDVVRSLRQRQIETISVTDVQASTDYTVTIDDVIVTVTSGLAPTAQSIRDLIVAAVNSADVLDSWVGYIGDVKAADGSGVGDFTLSATPGYEFSPELDTKLTLDAHQGAVDLAYQLEYGINDLTAMLETKSEKRVQMDVRFGLSLRRFGTIDTIEEVEIDLNDLEFEVTSP